MMLNDAIRLATTEPVIYFLLTAYIETLDYYDPPRSSIPARAKRLPVVGKADLRERLRVLRDASKAHAQPEPIAHAVIEEAVEVFSTALQRLTALHPAMRCEGLQNRRVVAPNLIAAGQLHECRPR